MVIALRIRLIANSPPNIYPNRRASRVSSIVILRVNVSTLERIRSRSDDGVPNLAQPLTK